MSIISIKSYQYIIFFRTCYTVAMEYLGIDFGTKRIGIAGGNDITRIATPLDTYTFTSDIYQQLCELVKNREAETIIIGDTKNMHGNDNAVTPQLEKFITELKKHIHIPIVAIGEQMTSREAARLSGFGGFEKRNQANQRGRQKFTGDTDASAAALILQRHLDTL